MSDAKFGEPWYVDSVGLVRSNIGQLISALPSAAYQARGLACVNALAGIPDPEKFVKAVKGLIAESKHLDDPTVPWARLRNALASLEQAGKEEK